MALEGHGSDLLKALDTSIALSLEAKTPLGLLLVPAWLELAWPK